jgi:hypothetical protein
VSKSSITARSSRPKALEAAVTDARAREEVEPIEDEVVPPRRLRTTLLDRRRSSCLIGSTSDPVRMYLKEIGRVRLLTGPEEVKLAKRIEAGVLAQHRLADGDSERAPTARDVIDGEYAKSERSRRTYGLSCRSQAVRRQGALPRPHPGGATSA